MTRRLVPLRARTAAEPEPDLTSMVVTHRAIRQDLARAAALCGAIAGRGLPPGQARDFCRHTAALLAAVRAHDENEETIIWPVIAATARQAVDLTPLTDDHQAIEVAATRASQTLACLAAEPDNYAAALRASVAALRDMVDEHIADEEAQLLPVMRRYMTAGAWRWCERQILHTAAPPGLRFNMPWLARHAADDELRPLLIAGGWPARIALVGSRLGYGRLERRAFGVGHDTRSLSRGSVRPVMRRNRR